MVEVGLAVKSQIDTAFAAELEQVDDEEQIAARLGLYMPFVFDSLQMAYEETDREAVHALLVGHLQRFFGAAAAT